MTGMLGLFSLTDLVQLLATSSRSGTLVVEHPTGRAHLEFVSGDVRHVEFGDLVGIDAFCSLLADERGAFSFVDATPSGRTTVFGSSQATLLESARRLDESRRVDEPDVVAIPPDAIATPTGRNVVDPRGLSDTERRVLELADGVRTVLNVAEACGRSFEDVSRVVERLVAADLLDASRRRPRTARLVVRSGTSLPHGTVAVDASWLAGWERAMGRPPTVVECRSEAGVVELRSVVAHDSGSPYLLVSTESMLASEWTLDQAFLVRPAAATDGVTRR